MSPAANFLATVLLGSLVVNSMPSACQDYSTLPPAPPPDPYTPRASRPSGKVRDTAPKPKPRRKERRSPRHTQRRRG